MDEKKVKAFWEKRAKIKDYRHYESLTEFNDTKEAERRNKIELDELRKLNISKNSIALDLGCGTGRYASVLSEKCKKVIAIDYSKDMLNVAKSLNKRDNIMYLHGDVTTFTSKEKFDIIVVAGLFIYMNDNAIIKTLYNISKLLKKEGILFFRSSVGIEKKLVIDNKYSEELKTDYSAIYRTRNELNILFSMVGLIPIEEKTLYQFRKETYQIQLLYMKEKIVGILGGMGSYASLDLYKKVLDNCKTNKDWEYPRLLIDSNTKIPSRTRALLYGEESPEKVMTRSINNLGKIGADMVIVACNSAHYFINKKTKTPVKSIIEIIYEVVKKDNVKKVGLLAGTVTVEKKLYEKVFKNIEVITLPKYQNNVISLIEKVKKEISTEEDKDEMENIIKKLIEQGSEGIIIGCTELPYLYRPNSKCRVYDVNDIVSKYIINYSKRKIP